MKEEESNRYSWRFGLKIGMMVGEDSWFTSLFQLIRDDTSNEVRVGRLQCRHQLIQLFLKFGRYWRSSLGQVWSELVWFSKIEGVLRFGSVCKRKQGSGQGEKIGHFLTIKMYHVWSVFR